MLQFLGSHATGHGLAQRGMQPRLYQEAQGHKQEAGTPWETQRRRVQQELLTTEIGYSSGLSPHESWVNRQELTNAEAKFTELGIKVE